jgi:hypothetical protein
MAFGKLGAMGRGMGHLGDLGTVSWSPLSLGTSLLAWWTADRPDLITLSGASVTSWKDVKNAYDVTQGVSASRPVYSATSFNGAPGLTFDGTDDALVLASQPFPSGASPSELWAIVSQDALAADTSVRCAGGYGSLNATSRRLNRIVTSGVNRGQVIAGDGAGATGPSGTTVDFSGRFVHRGRVTATQTTQTLNSSNDGSASVVPATDTTRVVIGASPGGASGASFYNGKIRDFIITAQLSTDQATALLTWALPRRMP